MGGGVGVGGEEAGKELQGVGVGRTVKLAAIPEGGVGGEGGGEG